MKKLTEGNIYKTFILFAIPLVLSGLLSQAYHLIDTMIAGRFLGESALAAIGATSSFISFISSILWGYSGGFGIYIARLFGAGETEKIKRGICTHLLLISGIGILVAILTIVFHESIFDLLSVEEALRHETFTYFSIYMSGLFLIILNINGGYLMNALGISTFPFYMSLISATINVSGNILSVTLLHLGVAGIALSTVLSAGVTAIAYIFRLRRCFRELDPERRPFKLKLTESRQALSYSIPSMLQQLSMYCAGMLLSPMLNSTGSAALASYVVTQQILAIHTTIFQNSSRSISNYAAQCLGERRDPSEKRAMIGKGLRVAFLQNLLFTLPVLVVCMIFPRAITSIFFSAGSAEESIRLATVFIRFFLPFVLFNLVDNLFHSFFRGVKAMPLLITSTVFASVVRVAVSWPLTYYFGINGFYAGMCISWIAEVVLVLILYWTGAWIPSELKRKNTARPLSNAHK